MGDVPESVSYADEIHKTRALHLGITISATLTFFPLIYLIGWPFCFVKFRELANNSTNPHIPEHYRSLIVLGWFTYIFGIATMAIYCVSPAVDILTSFYALVSIPPMNFVMTMSVCIFGSTFLHWLEYPETTNNHCYCCTPQSNSYTEF